MDISSRTRLEAFSGSSKHPGNTHIRLMMATMPRSDSVGSTRSRMSISQSRDIVTGEVSIYKGISNRPLGWKPRRQTATTVAQGARDANLRRFDGAGRRSLDWDGLRRDPELWFPDGDCLVYLSALGHSQRGPSFKISYSALLKKGCEPLLARFLVSAAPDSPRSNNSTHNGSHLNHSSSKTTQYELYMPAPTSADRGQAMKYHVATRNFFAWVFGRSVVGSHLGAALVGVLNSMNEFRDADADNVQDILDFMDEEGYADMRSAPQHALAVLFFAEHFHFRDLYMDAFTHCAGMFEVLPSMKAYEFTSESSRSLLQKVRTDMDRRLNRCGISLSTFLEEEMSAANLGLSIGARSHLDRFRQFLHTYYVAKMGYYPPTVESKMSHAFPKVIYEQMYTDFEMLYELLADKDSLPNTANPSAMGGLCVMQATKAFDDRHHYEPLQHSLPLMPQAEADLPAKRSSIFGFNGRKNKLKLDDRLVALSTLTKATNGHLLHLNDSSLVRAYKIFEKECIFSSTRNDRSRPISAGEARKVRWLLIYAVLQVLRSATRAPSQVRDTDNVKYNICVSTAGCPPFIPDLPVRSLMRTQSQFTADESTSGDSAPASPQVEELQPDLNYHEIHHAPVRPVVQRTNTVPSNTKPYRGSVYRAVSSLGNMPELKHPKPQRNSFSEILVSGYGNGINTVSITAEPLPVLEIDTALVDSIGSRHISIDSSDASDSGHSFRWSTAGEDAESSASSVSRRSSFHRKSLGDGQVSPLTGSPIDVSKHNIQDLLAQSWPVTVAGTNREAYVVEPDLAPEPLALKKDTKGITDMMLVTKSVSISYEEATPYEELSCLNPEVEAYLAT